MNALPVLLICLGMSAATVWAAETPNVPNAKQGETLYKKHCLGCHGATGRGDGPASRALPVRPANLAISRAPDDYLKLVIAEGGDAMGRSAVMPPWSPTLSKTDIDALALYINTLRPKP